MTLTQLHYLLTIVETKSLNKAAEQLYVTQPSLTSAVKDIANAVVISLDDYFAEGGKWSEAFAGQSVRYGMKDNCAGIPMLETEWKFQHVTMKKCYEIYTQIGQGKIFVSEEIEERPGVAVTVKYL